MQPVQVAKEKKENDDNDNGAEQEEKLPPLSPAQFREYNRMAEHMDHFVSN